MSYQRYSSEFKREAVKQVAERGHFVSEASKRLGISNKSLYVWLSELKGSNGKGDSPV